MLTHAKLNTALHTVADNWHSLQGCDVKCLLSCVADAGESLEAAAAAVNRRRPDLASDVQEALAELTPEPDIVGSKTSEARQVADLFERAGDDGSLLICAPPAPSTISHPNYSVSYYADQSVLILARGEKPLVLDEPRTYYRDTTEHLARCLGLTTQEKRAEIVQRSEFFDAETRQCWIDGILWNADGTFAEIN